MKEDLKVKENTIEKLQAINNATAKGSPQKSRLEELSKSIRLQEESLLEYNSNLSAIKENEAKFNERELKLKDLLAKKDEAYDGLKVENQMLSMTVKRLEQENTSLQKKELTHEKKILHLQREVMDREKEVLEIQRRANDNANISNGRSKTDSISEVQLLHYEGKIERLHLTEQNLKIQNAKLETELNATKRALQELRSTRNLDQSIDGYNSRSSRRGNSQTPSKRSNRPPIGSASSRKERNHLVEELDQMQALTTREFSTEKNPLLSDKYTKDRNPENLYKEVMTLRETLAQKNDVIKK